MYLTLIALGVLLGTYLISWGLCVSAKRGDRQMERELVGQRLAMQQQAFRWPPREDA